MDNVLDLILSTIPDSITNTHVADGLPGSDHHAVLFEIGCKFKQRNLPSMSVYNFKKANFDSFRDLLSKIAWNCCFISDSIDDIWSNFKDLLFAAADQCIPRYTLKPGKQHKLWLSGETLKLIKQKCWTFKKSKQSLKDKDTQLYKVISNRVHTLTTQDHKRHLDTPQQP